MYTVLQIYFKEKFNTIFLNFVGFFVNTRIDQLLEGKDL